MSIKNTEAAEVIGTADAAEQPVVNKQAWSEVTHFVKGADWGNSRKQSRRLAGTERPFWMAFARFELLSATRLVRFVRAGADRRTAGLTRHLSRLLKMSRLQTSFAISACWFLYWYGGSHQERFGACHGHVSLLCARLWHHLAHQAYHWPGRWCSWDQGRCERVLWTLSCSMVDWPSGTSWASYLDVQNKPADAAEGLRWRYHLGRVYCRHIC